MLCAGQSETSETLPHLKGNMDVAKILQLYEFDGDGNPRLRDNPPPPATAKKHGSSKKKSGKKKKKSSETAPKPRSPTPPPAPAKTKSSEKKRVRTVKPVKVTLPTKDVKKTSAKKPLSRKRKASSPLVVSSDSDSSLPSLDTSVSPFSDHQPSGRVPPSAKKTVISQEAVKRAVTPRSRKKKPPVKRTSASKIAVKQRSPTPPLPPDNQLKTVRVLPEQYDNFFTQRSEFTQA